MITPERKFVRRLRRALRVRLRANPTWRREWKQRRLRWWKRRYGWEALRGFVPLVVFFLAAQSPADAWLAGALTLWTTSLTLVRAGQIANLLHAPAVLATLFQMPVPNEAVFRHHERIVLRSSWWLALDWFAFGGGRAIATSSPALACAIPLLVFTQWAAALGIAMTLVRWRPSVPYGFGPLILNVFLFISVQNSMSGRAPSGFVLNIYRFFTQTTPGGWVVRAFIDAGRGGATGWGLLVGGAVLSGWLLVIQRRGLREAFSLERIFGYDTEPPSAVPGWTATEPGATRTTREVPLAPPQPVLRIDRPELRRKIDDALSRPAGMALFRRGFLERQITRLLPERQRLLADFLQPRGLSWTRGWLIALGLIVVAHLSLRLQALPVFPVIGLVAAALAGLPLFGNHWIGFESATPLPMRIGLNSYYPMGFWEIAKLILTISWLRCVVAFPLILLAARFGLPGPEMSWVQAAAQAVRIEIILVAAQPGWVVLVFSKNTNDTSARPGLVLVFAAFILIAILAGVTAGVVLFAADTLESVLYATAVLLAIGYGGLAIYGWLYNGRWFDLVGRSRAV